MTTTDTAPSHEEAVFVDPTGRRGRGFRFSMTMLYPWFGICSIVIVLGLLQPFDLIQLPFFIDSAPAAASLISADGNAEAIPALEARVGITDARSGATIAEVAVTKVSIDIPAATTAEISVAAPPPGVSGVPVAVVPTTSAIVPTTMPNVAITSVAVVAVPVPVIPVSSLVAAVLAFTVAPNVVVAAPASTTVPTTTMTTTTTTTVAATTTTIAPATTTTVLPPVNIDCGGDHGGRNDVNRPSPGPCGHGTIVCCKS